jgi:hypothetical protein
MVGDTLATLHGVVLVLLIILMGIVLVIALVANTGTAAVPWLGVGIGVLGVLAHIWFSRINPNKDLEANKTKAAAEVQKGVLKLDWASSTGPMLDEAQARPTHGKRAMALGLMLVGIALLPTGEIVRMASGWPKNGDCEPMVIGPGDQPKLFLPSKVKSIKGFWNGQATVTVLNADELGLANPRLECSTNTKTWGGIIFGKSVRAEDVNLWTIVNLPSTDNLSDKIVRLRVNMDVNYPAERGHGFENEEKSIEDTIELHLASPHAGRTYRLLWWGGGVTGGILILLGSVWLIVQATAIKKTALPSKAIPMEEDVPVLEPVRPGEDDDEPQDVLPVE